MLACPRGFEVQGSSPSPSLAPSLLGGCFDLTLAPASDPSSAWLKIRVWRRWGLFRRLGKLQKWKLVICCILSDIDSLLTPFLVSAHDSDIHIADFQFEWLEQLGHHVVEDSSHVALWWLTIAVNVTFVLVLLLDLRKPLIDALHVSGLQVGSFICSPLAFALHCFL